MILFYDPKLPGGIRNLGIAFGGSYDHTNQRPGAVHDVVFQHNTMIPAATAPCWNSMFFSASGQMPPMSNLTNNIWILDNVLCRQPSGDYGLQGTNGLTQYMGSPPPLDGRFTGNVIYVPAGDRAQSFPPHNLVTQKPPTFDSQYQLTVPGSSAETTDKKPAGFSPVASVLRQLDASSARQ